jgi:hypothetical protein
MNRAFSKEEVQMTKKHMKKCSTITNVVKNVPIYIVGGNVN